MQSRRHATHSRRIPVRRLHGAAGDADWSELDAMETSADTTTYEATIENARFGVMLACTSESGVATRQLFYRFVGDGTDFDLTSPCVDQVAESTVRGSVAGAAPGDITVAGLLAARRDVYVSDATRVSRDADPGLRALLRGESAVAVPRQ